MFYGCDKSGDQDIENAYKEENALIASISYFGTQRYLKRFHLIRNHSHVINPSLVDLVDTGHASQKRRGL
jgi:hypothetical protein